MIRRPPRSTLFPTRRSSDLRIFVLGATALGVLYIMEKSDMVREKPDDSLEALETAIQKGNTPSKYNNIGKPCTTPTKENPMGNVLMSDYVDRPDRKSTRSELQSHHDLVCRLLLEKKKKNITNTITHQNYSNGTKNVKT